MVFFEWDASLDVNVDEMNNQHKTLVGLMDVLYKKNTAGAPKQELMDSAGGLVNFVIKHFQDEEGYMASINFPGLEAHKQIHKNLMVDLNKFVGDFVNGSDEKISDEFITFLKFWLSTHIRGIDTKYGMK